MAGPTLQLRAKFFGKVEKNKLLTILNRIAIVNAEEKDAFEFRFKKGKTLGLNLKFNSCLFLLNIFDTIVVDASSIADLTAKLKDKPEAYISIASMCNQKEDHILLAKFALEINKIVGGFIDLNGAIIAPLLKNSKGEFIHHTKADEVAYVNAIKGQIHEIAYAVSETRNYYSHIVDAEWLANWTMDKDFYLIK